jgi:arylformamidase
LIHVENTAFVDISMPLTDEMPVWPGSPGARTRLLKDFASGDEATVTGLDLDVHTGTHADAPRHSIPGGATMGEMGLRPMVGPALVVDVSAEADVNAKTLEALVPDGTDRLLLHTRNSTDTGYQSGPFREDYAALTLDAAEWAASRGLSLIGIDYLSIQLFTDSPDTHRVLLGGNVCILEGLNLVEVKAGEYFLVCLPLRLEQSEAAPARAILMEMNS